MIVLWSWILCCNPCWPLLGLELVDSEWWWILKHSHCAATSRSVRQLVRQWVALPVVSAAWHWCEWGGIAEPSIEVNPVLPAVNTQHRQTEIQYHLCPSTTTPPWAPCSTRVWGWSWALSTRPTPHSKLSRLRTWRWGEHDNRRNLTSKS